MTTKAKNRVMERLKREGRNESWLVDKRLGAVLSGDDIEKAIMYHAHNQQLRFE